MGDYFLAAGSALWLGVLTSVSPCPLATNIAAISYIAKGIEKPRQVVLSGVLYTLGRAVAYVVLGILLAYGLHSAPYVSSFLQKYMNKILGPLLIVVGMLLLELIRVSSPGSGAGERIGRRVEGMGPVGAGLLGIVFALSFCPVSAALFFGTLIPLSVKNDSTVLLPLLYGVGTALPVAGFAGVIAAGARSLGKAYSNVVLVERWARRATGVVFIGVGVYLTLVHVFGVSW
jgi:cytochrome c-type biogenesis protein